MDGMRIRHVVWILIGCVGVAGVGITSAWVNAATAARLALAFTIVAALGALVGAALTAWGNRAAARSQHEVATKQTDMARDIRRLAELTQSSLEEARAQSPDPFVRFLVGAKSEPAEAAVLRRIHFRRTIDIENIVANEKDAAMASLRAAQTSTPSATSGETKGTLGAFPSLDKMAQASVFGIGALTAQDRKDFEAEVEKYAASLRKWLMEYQGWREETQFIFVSNLCFENHGRVPGRDLRIELRFPDGFEPVEEFPSLAGPSRRPHFKPRNYADLLVGLRSPAMSMPDLMRFPPPTVPADPNVSSPRYRNGSCIVEFSVKKLLHGVREDTEEPLMLRITNDGTYTILWTIHAENLGEPATGELSLEITTDIEDGPAVTSLDELRFKESAEDDEAED
jgi:hypothetical protein